jgi:undecaprenyl-diphosphatase
LTLTLQKRSSDNHQASRLKVARQTRLKAVQAMLLFSVCMITPGLILFSVIGQLGSVSAVALGGSHGTLRVSSDDSSPIIVISSPKNVTYTMSNIPLTFSVHVAVVWMGYSLDGRANVTTSGNTTLASLTQGAHHVIVYCNDTSGKTYSSATVYFTTTNVSFQEIVALGLVQGFGEWLPISSTAHLKIAEWIMGLTHTALLDVTLHVGTLVVVVFYFRKDVKDILAALFHLDFKSESGRLIIPIILATIPTGIIGLLYTKFLQDTFQTFLIIGTTFLIGATVLYVSKIGKENTDTVTFTVALIMGTAQGLATFPGLSRSGITISTALLLGLKREKAFKFSFLLSIPAIIGDLAVEAYLQRGQLAVQSISSTGLLAGIVAAIIAGYIAIRIVSNVVRSKRFHYFAFYTVLLGIALIALTLTGFLTT